MFCALLTSRYQVSVYRTNGPLVKNRIRISTQTMVSSLPISLVFNFTNGFHLD